MSERIFVDTSAWYALADPSERDRHQRAQATMMRLIAAGSELHTTNYIVVETHALVLNRVRRDIAEHILDQFYTSATCIIRATEGDESRAREIIRRFQDKPYSLTNAISFAVMQRLHLETAWTFDHHFEEMGFARIE